MTDILLEEDNGVLDTQFENGDFKLGDDTGQRAFLLLKVQKGHFKQHPLCGVGIESMLGGTLTQQLKREITLQLESDNIKATNIRLSSDGELNMDIQ